MFYGLQNILNESRYFLQYLNKFPFMVIVSNFVEITPPPTNLKVPNLWSDFSVSNFVKSNFLQRFSKLCRITLNDFRCATVSHSSAWCKSWDKHDFNKVASSILARNIIIIIYRQPSNSSNIYVKLYSVILTYILILIHFCDDINMLPQWFQRMLWAGIELATSLRSCLPELLRHVELWLTVAQRKSFNTIPYNFEKRCKIC